MQIVPELEPVLVTGHPPGTDGPPLGYGARQRFAEMASSLTTTSSVVATLNSVLAGSLASAVIALAGSATAFVVTLGLGVSLISAALHVRYAARYRRSHLAPVAVEGDDRA